MSKLKKLGFGHKKNKPGTNGIVDTAGMSHNVTSCIILFYWILCRPGVSTNTINLKQLCQY